MLCWREGAAVPFPSLPASDFAGFGCGVSVEAEEWHLPASQEGLLELLDSMCRRTLVPPRYRAVYRDVWEYDAGQFFLVSFESLVTGRA